MGIQVSGAESYLYLNGIAVSSPVRLSETVDLLPAQCDCHAELFLGLGKTDVDISVISLFLPLVRSQLHVRGSDPKDTAVRVWNAQWDGLLLGALVGCEVVANLQSDIPADLLKPDSAVVVTNYHLRGLSADEPHCLTESEAIWMDRHFAQARSLLDEDAFRNAVHCLATYRWHTMAPARIAIIWSGIEGLFGVDSEIVFRVSLYAAKFLVPDDRARQLELFSHVKQLYKLRSKAVHGGRMSGDAGAAAVDESAELLRNLVLRCAERGALPDIAELVP